MARNIKLDTLILDVIDITRGAHGIIKAIYESDSHINIKIKDDNSPVTKADKLADEYIRSKLFSIEPSIPIISEESSTPDFKERKDWECLWLVDPLDGTKEFIERTDEFTVNIALIEKNEPILGVVGVPMTGEVFAWYKGAESSFYVCGESRDRTLLQRELTKKSDKVKVLVSRRHTNDEKLHSWLQGFGFPYEIGECGSSLKMCRIAKGDGDIYVRLGPTSEWDTAAGHAILRGIGGGIYENTPLLNTEVYYNSKESLINPEFIAVKSINWFKNFADN